MTDDLIERLRAKADWREAGLQRDKEHHRRSRTAFDEAKERQHALVPDISLADLQDALARIATQQEAIDELVAALTPFATAAEDIDERTRGDSNMWEHPASMNVYASDFRDAAALLSKHGERT